MNGRQRRVEAHRLTISGLSRGTSYVELLEQCFDKATMDDLQYDGATKQHFLHEVVASGQGLFLRFISYRSGHRPDIVNTSDLTLRTTPLKRTETGVEWTNCWLGKKHGRHYLIVERNSTGIWPTTIEEYLQWFLGRMLPDFAEYLVVTLEPEPGPEFVSRLENLDRIMVATYRVTRPNPGWSDLESEMARESQDSDARKTEVSMYAKRGGTLSKVNGIVKAIRDSFAERRLDHAKIKGERSGIPETLNTDKLVLHRYIRFRLDAFGQVDHKDAMKKMVKMFDEMN